MQAFDLINARESILRGALEYFRQKPRITGVFLSGSLATEESDCFSDIDLRVLVEDDWVGEFVDRRLFAPKEWHEGFLFNEWKPDAKHCVSHFLPFVKVDCFYIALSELNSPAWSAFPVRSLYDPKGVIRIFKSKHSCSRETPLSREEAERMLAKSISCAHEALRRHRRGEHHYALDLAQDCLKWLIRLDDRRNGRETISDPLSRLESGSRRLSVALNDFSNIPVAVGKLSHFGLELSEWVNCAISLGENFDKFSKAWTLSITQDLPILGR